MYKSMIIGMMMQAFTSGILSFFGFITLSAPQQLVCAGLLFFILLVIFVTEFGVLKSFANLENDRYKHKD